MLVSVFFQKKLLAFSKVNDLQTNKLTAVENFCEYYVNKIICISLQNNLNLWIQLQQIKNFIILKRQNLHFKNNKLSK